MVRTLRSTRKFEAQFSPQARLCSVAAALIGGAAISAVSAKSAANSQAKSNGKAIDASNAQAAMANELGKQELDFAKQQYADAKPLAEKVVNQQVAIADQTAAQGADYFDYLKSYRPAERAMMYESMGMTPEEAAQLEQTQQSGTPEEYQAQLSSLGTAASQRRTDELNAGKALDQADAAVAGGSDSAVYAGNKAEIDSGVGRAIADTQDGYSRSVNQAVREGLRYGGSNASIGGTVGGAALAQASNVAAAANGARTTGIATERGLATTRMGLRSQVTNNITQQRAMDWAKKLDATGLAKGMPGASAGAYSLAVGAGNAAMRNQAAPGNNYQAGLGSATNTMLSGAQAQTNTMMGLTGQTNPMAQVGMAVGGKLMGAGMGYGLS